VRYVDWQEEVIPEGNMFQPFLHKRAGFEYEHEIRAITDKYPVKKDGSPDPDADIPRGLPIPVDVRRLITRVRLSPVADRWYQQVVRSVVARYGFKLEVVQSDLAGQPVF
jgi:hypothetical protein